MNQETKKLLCGMSIGDGYCRYNTLYVIHGPKQFDYVEYKKKLLTDVGLIVSDIRRSVRTNNSNYDQIGFSVSNRYIKWVRQRLYCGIQNEKFLTRKFVNKLSPQAIAIWYMDDGSLYSKKRNGVEHSKEIVISTYCSENEINDLISYFNEEYNVFFTKKRNKGKFSLRCGKKNAKKFLDIVKPYSCESMNYKFDI